MTTTADQNNVTKSITTKEAARAMNVSVPRIHTLIKENRIEGAYKVGDGRGFWLMPANPDGKPTVLPPKKKVA